MPSCKDCKWRKEKACKAHEHAHQELKRPLPPAPSGACTYAIVESYESEIKTNMKVLEVGCGTWTKVSKACEKAGAEFEGLDVAEEYYGIKSHATRLENLADLSYPDETFDIVIGNQTMEHWGEYGCSPEWGLYQCFRVLKPGGRLFINVPIHFHGTKDFLHGKLDKIEALFAKFSRHVQIEAWGQPTDPIEPFYAQPNFWGLRNKPAYVLDIRATKDKSLPTGITNRWGLTGQLGKLIHYSPSYNLYRVLKKMSLVK